ncbi:MAG: 3-phosphoshikimate 1-carboxyvinyltransferase [Rhodobiaceae bacterium]|nr:3-phosphoshikimate 1-carboxyvinyltransferase [Rhodobiaceae bacterium]
MSDTAHDLAPNPLTAWRGKALAGEAPIPGDKSISHRALILGALAHGETRIEGLLEGEDILATARVMAQLGAKVERLGYGSWRVVGAGAGALLEPDGTLDFGNSGTGARLLMGVVAGHGIKATFDGDASLRKRPMGRVLKPLATMGAWVEGGAEKLPLTLHGALEPIPVTHRLAVPSAQVKSAMLLAGLTSRGVTTVIEPEATRDHTERMLAHFGARLDIETDREGARHISLKGGQKLKGAPVAVPADPSSAAFPLVAAVLVPGSRIEIPAMMTNPTRTGLVTTLIEMGAKITLRNERDAGGEPVADVLVEAGALTGVDVPADRAPSMIDEYPVLAVAASFASGVTRMRGLSELRVKESDRLAAVAAGLAANGVRFAIEGDDLIVEGMGARVPGGGTVETHMDHRIAMSFLVMGLAAEKPVTVDDGRMIMTSFPAFRGVMEHLGADIRDGAA